MSLLGVRHDIPELLSAFDCVLLPSRFEGAPFVVLEAQAAGLPVIVSTAVPEEMLVLTASRRLSLRTHAGTWAREIVEAAEHLRAPDAADKLEQNGFSLASAVNDVQRLYLRLGAGYGGGSVGRATGES